MSPKYLLTYVCVAYAACTTAQADAVFSYFGEDRLPGSSEHQPEVVDGELGNLKELYFQCGDETSDSDWANFVELPARKDEISELTVALFLKPERGQANEALVSCKWDSGNTGFRLYKSWNHWMFDAGDGTQSQQIWAENRDADLQMNEWQHLAVTFKNGEVRLYKDGILVREEKIPLQSILIDNILRIGAGVEKSYGFSGRMAGIFIDTEALDPVDIAKLMQKATP